MVRRKRVARWSTSSAAADASAKWLFWGAVLGAGLALLYAPRSGEETRRVLQRKLWKLRAMTEEKLDELAQQFERARRRSRTSWTTTTRTWTSSTTPALRSRAATGRPPRARSSSGAWPNRGPGAARPVTTRSRSPERVRPGGWHRHARRLPPPHPAGRRRKQHPVSGERAHLRRAARGGAVRSAGPDRADATWRRPWPAARGRPDRAVPPLLSAPLLRPRARSVRAGGGTADRGLAEPRTDLALRDSGLHLVQHPAVRRRPHLAQRHLRRLGAPGAAAATSCSTGWPASCVTSRWWSRPWSLFLVNTALEHHARHRVGARVRAGDPAVRVLLLHDRPAARRAAGLRVLGLALLRDLPLRLAPPPPLADGAARLDLHRGAVRDRQAALRPVPCPLRLLESSAGDANIGAAVLFILWVYYTAIVFLLGGVVAETWDLRRMQQRQRIILG